MSLSPKNDETHDNLVSNHLSVPVDFIPDPIYENLSPSAVTVEQVQHNNFLIDVEDDCDTHISQPKNH